MGTEFTEVSARGKVSAIVQSLKATILLGEPGSKLPTVRSLAQELDVSLATLTLALNRLEAEGLVNRRPGSGVYVAERSSTGRMCILIEPTVMIGASPFWARLIRCLAEPLVRAETSPLIFCTPPYLRLEDRQAAPESLVPDRLRFLVDSQAIECVLAVSVAPSVVQWLESRQIHVVAYDSPAKYTVEMAALEACQIGVSELVRNGCRRIAVWGVRNLAQHEIFTALLSAHNLENFVIRQPQVQEVDQRALLTPPDLINEGYEAAIRAFSGPTDTRADGALSLTATFTLGLLMGLNRLGLVPGKDVHIATPQNRGVATLRGWEHQITRMEFDPEAAAAAMRQAAASLMAGEPVATGAWERAVQVGDGNFVLQIRPQLLRPAAVGCK